MSLGYKKLFATFCLFSFFSLLPMSCGLLCRDSCGCGPSPKAQEMRIKTFSLETVDDRGAKIADSQVKSYNQIFRTLRIDEVEYLSENQDINSPSFSFGTAFACDPAPPTTENTLYLIQIINEREFTSSDGIQFMIGEDISSLFGMNHFYTAGLTTIDNFVAPGLKLYRDESFKIGVLENPGKDLLLKFTIRLVFDDAQEFLLTDQVLNIR